MHSLQIVSLWRFLSRDFSLVSLDRQLLLNSSPFFPSSICHLLICFRSFLRLASLHTRRIWRFFSAAGIRLVSFSVFSFQLILFRILYPIKNLLFLHSVFDSFFHSYSFCIFCSRHCRMCAVLDVCEWGGRP